MTDTIGVCGFGRCGSSMVMAMLDACGVPPVEGSSDRGYELRGGLDSIPADGLAGRAVKLLDGVTYHRLPKASWRFVWLDRDPRQQALSFVKFVEMLQLIPPGQVDLSVIEESYRLDRPRRLAAYEALGPVLTLNYEAVLANPAGAAHALAGFVDVDGFDITAAAGVVHKRSGDCRPGMIFERYGVPA